MSPKKGMRQDKHMLKNLHALVQRNCGARPRTLVLTLYKLQKNMGRSGCFRSLNKFVLG